MYTYDYRCLCKYICIYIYIYCITPNLMDQMNMDDCLSENGWFLAPGDGIPTHGAWSQEGPGAGDRRCLVMCVFFPLVNGKALGTIINVWNLMNWIHELYELNSWDLVFSAIYFGWCFFPQFNVNEWSPRPWADGVNPENELERSTMFNGWAMFNRYS